MLLQSIEGTQLTPCISLALNTLPDHSLFLPQVAELCPTCPHFLHFRPSTNSNADLSRFLVTLFKAPAGRPRFFATIIGLATC